MIKFVMCCCRHPGMTREEFQDYWLNEHPKAVLKLGGLQRYVQDHPLKNGYAKRELPVDGMVKHFREWLIGRDPMQRGALWQEMYRSQYFEGGRVLTAAISAIHIALYDAVARSLV